MISFLILDAQVFLQAKAYISKDSKKEDGCWAVEFKLITSPERIMVIAR